MLVSGLPANGPSNCCVPIEWVQNQKPAQTGLFGKLENAEGTLRSYVRPAPFGCSCDYRQAFHPNTFVDSILLY
jgi:hypothetical protein